MALSTPSQATWAVMTRANTGASLNKSAKVASSPSSTLGHHEADGAEHFGVHDQHVSRQMSMFRFDEAGARNRESRACRHCLSRASMPSRRAGSAKEAGQMARLRALAAAAASVVSLAFTVGWAVPASAGTSTGASTYSQPTWWQKFQTVSAPWFNPLPSPGKTGGVSVGSNVDMSNEPGPQ